MYLLGIVNCCLNILLIQVLEDTFSMPIILYNSKRIHVLSSPLRKWLGFSYAKIYSISEGQIPCLPFYNLQIGISYRSQHWTSTIRIALLASYSIIPHPKFSLFSLSTNGKSITKIRRLTRIEKEFEERRLVFLRITQKLFFCVA